MSGPVDIQSTDAERIIWRVHICVEREAAAFYVSFEKAKVQLKLVRGLKVGVISITGDNLLHRTGSVLARIADAPPSKVLGAKSFEAKLLAANSFNSHTNLLIEAQIR